MREYTIKVFKGRTEVHEGCLDNAQLYESRWLLGVTYIFYAWIEDDVTNAKWRIEREIEYFLLRHLVENDQL